MLDKLFLLQYVKECFIKVALALCNCHQQKDTSIASYKEAHTPQETQVFLQTHKADEMLPLTRFPFTG